MPTISIRLKARAIALDLGLDDFQGGASWCFRFMSRRELSIRSRTTVCQKLPEDRKEKIERFRLYVCDEIASLHLSLDDLTNMDEVSLTFDIPMTRTVEKVSEKTVPIKTTGHEKSSFMVILSWKCTASGKKIPLC